MTDKTLHQESHLFDNIISFRCCNEECGIHYPDSKKGEEHWQHAKLSFIQYLKHWIKGHDVYIK